MPSQHFAPRRMLTSSSANYAASQRTNRWGLCDSNAQSPTVIKKKGAEMIKDIQKKKRMKRTSLVKSKTIRRRRLYKWQQMKTKWQSPRLPVPLSQAFGLSASHRCCSPLQNLAASASEPAIFQHLPNLHSHLIVLVTRVSANEQGTHTELFAKKIINLVVALRQNQQET